MNTTTGLIHELENGEDMRSLARRLGKLESDFVEVSAKSGDGTCRKCNGTGAVRRGLLSRRFKPCVCIAVKGGSF